MTERFLFYNLVIGWLVLSIVIFISLFFIVAPYGRHLRGGWGPTINNRLGWILMEAASPLVFAICFAVGDYNNTVIALLFLLLWEAHYIHRAFIYPFAINSSINQMPLAIISTAVLFNAINAYINGRYIFTISGGYSNSWLVDPRFIAGLALFIIGFIINRQSDHTLRKLRKLNEFDYKIPRGGLYRWISCPNYLGEITEWIGWAIATWSLPGLAFAAWTAANLVPRARAHHSWYHKHFPDYPRERKVLIPGIW